MKNSLLRSDPIAICLMIGSSRSAAEPSRNCGVTAVSSTTTPAALALARPAAAPMSSTDAAASFAIAATSSSRAKSPAAIRRSPSRRSRRHPIDRSVVDEPEAEVLRGVGPLQHERGVARHLGPGFGGHGLDAYAAGRRCCLEPAALL